MDNNDGAYLTNGKTYYYIVRAADAYGNMESNTKRLSGTPNDAMGPEFSGLLFVQDLRTGNAVKLTWDEAKDRSPPITYRIYRAKSEVMPDTPIAEVKGTYFVDENVTNNVEYYYMVRAVDYYGNSDNNTRILSVKPTDSTPPEFSGIEKVVDTGTGGALSISWSKASDKSGVKYRIYRGEGSSVNYSSPIAIISGTQYTDTGLENGKVYCYVVRAVDGYGNEDENEKMLCGVPTYPNTKPILSSPKAYPMSGYEDEEFTLSVVYKDDDGDAPAYVRVYIDSVPYDMVSIEGGDYKEGVTYRYSTYMKAGTHIIYFEARDDAESNPATSGDSYTVKSSAIYVDVKERENPPELYDYGVNKEAGENYLFYVIYRDEDGDAAAYVEVYIDGTPYTMVLESGDPLTGAKYVYTARLTPGKHIYYFKASDGKKSTITGQAYVEIAEKARGGIIEALRSQKIAGVSELTWLIIIIVLIIGIIASGKKKEIVACPRCGSAMEVPRKPRPVRVICPACGTRFMLR